MRERKTETEKKKEAEAEQKLKTIAIKRQERDSQVIRKTFDTEDGRRCLKLIMERCKYQSPITYVSDDGVIHTENLQHNAALQGLYLWLRKNINDDTLIAVEVIGLDDSLKGNEK